MPRPAPSPVSDDLERFLNRDGETTLGGLIDVFGRKSFALVFVLLLGKNATTGFSDIGFRAIQNRNPVKSFNRRIAKINGATVKCQTSRDKLCGPP